MDLGTSLAFFSLFIMCSALIAFLGAHFSKGKWLEHITLIDLSKHDREGIARISSLMMYMIAFSFSVTATLSFWITILIATFIAMAVIVAVCLIGYICMARVPKAIV